MEISSFFYHSDFTWNGEINFEDFWSAKSAILTLLEALNFYFYLFLHFLKVEIDQINQILGPKKGQNGSFRTYNFYILPNWFHVTYEWQKNPVISTLCYHDNLTIEG